MNQRKKADAIILICNKLIEFVEMIDSYATAFPFSVEIYTTVILKNAASILRKSKKNNFESITFSIKKNFSRIYSEINELTIDIKNYLYNTRISNSQSKILFEYLEEVQSLIQIAPQAIELMPS